MCVVEAPVCSVAAPAACAMPSPVPLSPFFSCRAFLFLLLFLPGTLTRFVLFYGILQLDASLLRPRPFQQERVVFALPSGEGDLNLRF